MPHLIDIHAHVNFAAFEDDRSAVIDRALAADIWHINVGTQLATSRQAVTLAEKYPEGVYAIIGLHPIHTDRSFYDQEELGAGGGAGFNSRGEVFDPAVYEDLAQSSKVVGLGEVGLDFFRFDSRSAIDKQTAAFEAQLALAERLNLPVMLHIRDSYSEVLSILADWPKVRTHAHFFSGDYTQAKVFLDRGDTLSFTGLITFTDRFDQLIRQLPLDRLMVETDCPYVAPTPHRGTRNEPAYVSRVAERLAAIKGLSVEKVAAVTTANARRVFNL